MLKKSRKTFFKQIDEKNVTQEVKQMLWNPKMDLLALSFLNGDVHLYRMSWQKVWQLNGPTIKQTDSTQTTSVKCMSWRPDGKQLAIAYTNNHLRLINVEDATKIFSYDFNSSQKIEQLYWIKEDVELMKLFKANNYYHNLSTRLLPNQINYDLIYHLFESSHSTHNTSKHKNETTLKNDLSNDMNELSFLICSHLNDKISIFINGQFLLIDREINSSLHDSNQLLATHLNDSCTQLSMISLNNHTLKFNLIDTTQIINKNHIEIKLISHTYSSLFQQLTQMRQIIKEMEEQWEDVLLEMDKKFQSYVNAASSTSNKQIKQEPMEDMKPMILQQQENDNDDECLLEIDNNNLNDNCSLAHDLLSLYSLGYCTNKFKTFLIHELTEKGLKKLEQSVDTYYSNIQRLINGQFNQLSLSMFFNLNELNGMCKWFNKYKIFNLNETQLNMITNNLLSLILKGQELNYVIEQNMKEIKLFFKWLHNCILYLQADDQHNAQSNANGGLNGNDSLNGRVLNEDMEQVILNFINTSFNHQQNNINLEKIGQYLKQQDLNFKRLNDLNDWQLFIKDKSYIKDNLYLNKHDKSLIACFNLFKTSLNELFRCELINLNADSFNIQQTHLIHSLETQEIECNQIQTSFKCIDNHLTLTSVLLNKSIDCYLIRCSSKMNVCIQKIHLFNNFLSKEVSFAQDLTIYSKDYLTCMAISSKNDNLSKTYLMQIEINHENNQANVSSLHVHDVHTSLRNIFSISSSRRVASLLIQSKQRVLMFETEYENESDMDESLKDANDNEDENKENTNDNGNHSDIESSTSSDKDSSIKIPMGKRSKQDTCDTIKL